MTKCKIFPRGEYGAKYHSSSIERDINIYLKLLGEGWDVHSITATQYEVILIVTSHNFALDKSES